MPEATLERVAVMPRVTQGHGAVVPEGFSLFADGPFLHLARRLPLLRPIIGSPGRRLLVAIAITWLPLLVLSIRGGVALHGVALPFLLDIQTQARLLLALPLYILAAHQAHCVMTPALKLFVERGVVQDKDRDKFRGILQAASGWNYSLFLRLALLATILLFGRGFWMQELASRQLSAWYGQAGASGVALTPAGYWLVWVVNPIFQYLHLLWILRLLMYAAMLARIALLDLHLVATHPDHAGGIGFLGEKSYAFANLLLAEGAAIAGVLANRIFHEGRSLMLFKMEIVVSAVVVTLLVLGPMCVFVPRLLQAKRKGLDDYGDVANRYTLDFEEAWLQGKTKAEGRELLGSGDVQSLADMANSHQVVVQMRPVPFSNMDAIETVAFFLLPIAPLVFTVLPPEELAKAIVRAFLG